jgi:hypothetical protein
VLGVQGRARSHLRWLRRRRRRVEQKNRREPRLPRRPGPRQPDAGGGGDGGGGGGGDVGVTRAEVVAVVVVVVLLRRGALLPPRPRLLPLPLLPPWLTSLPPADLATVALAEMATQSTPSGARSARCWCRGHAPF